MFRVALTADVYDAGGRLRFADMGLDVLDAAADVEYAALAEETPVITAVQMDGYQGILVLSGRVTAESLVRSEDLLALSRFGVGYDQIDVAACTASDVAVLTAVGAVDRSMAEATCWPRIAWSAAEGGTAVNTLVASFATGLVVPSDLGE